jgi:signal transduction histidine kinase
MKALESDSTVIQKFVDARTGMNALDFATPLSIGKKRWGTLKFAVSLKGVENEIRTTVYTVVLTTLIALMASFGIILVLSRRFIGPITDLARTMEKAGGDMLDVKVEVKGHDEIALLGRSFNRMIKRIKDANLELKKTHEQLLQSEKLASIGILASGVAHEINNPLGGLFNCVQMLEQMGEDKRFRKQYLGLIKDGLGKIEATVGKLLWMTRKGKREPVAVDIKNTLEDIYGFIEYRIRKSNFIFKEEIEKGLKVFIDPHDLQQVLLNLLINAIQSMKNGGVLGVSAYKKNSSVIIEVSDTGEGIEKEDINRIFDPFYTTKPPGEGTGLGLWLTYEIINNYKGEISVRSEKGKGSTFVLKLNEMFLPTDRQNGG